MAQHMILVDDMDSNIQYSGPWFTAPNPHGTGRSGPPFQNTLHGVNVDASFSFSFSGSSVTVLGTSMTTNASGSQNPTWECFVDNKSIGWSTPSRDTRNHWVFCQNSRLHDGPHVLSVKANVSGTQTFRFDQIQYIPSSNVSLDNQTLRIESNDSALQYSSGWRQFNDSVNLTQTAGSTLTYEFSGVSLAWVGFTPADGSLIPASATYSIDGQYPNSFLLPASEAGGAWYNQVLFQTGQLSAGNHKLVVTHNGNSSTAPLVLDYFVVQDSNSSSSNGTNTSSVAPSSSSSNPASNTPFPAPSSSSSNPASNSTAPSPNTKSPIGIIIGGVIGGAILIILLIALFSLIRRRNKQKTQGLVKKTFPASSRDVVQPFTLFPVQDLNSQLPPTFLSQNYISEGQSSQSIAAKLNGHPANSPSMSSNFRPTNLHSDAPSFSSAGVAVPTLATPLNQPSSGLPLAVEETNVVGGAVAEGQAPEMVQSTQRPSVSPRDGDVQARFARYEDSGLRIPPVEEKVFGLPPFYTPG